jgi:hypothetical protein
MSVRTILPWVIVGCFLVGAVAAYGLGFRPARRQTTHAIESASRLSERLRAAEPWAAGSAFAQSLGDARQIGGSVVKQSEQGFRAHLAALTRWFPRLGAVPADTEPKRDLFSAAYEFHKDELLREVMRRVRETTGKDLPSPVAISSPAFLTERRLPADLLEMQREQRSFNLEHVLLISAARAGAFPSRESDVRREPYPWQSPERWLRQPVDLRLRILLRSVPNLLRSLHALEKEGPVVVVRSLRTRVLPMPDQVEGIFDAEVDVSLEIVTLPDLAIGGAAK